jgi:hypothetical protein
MRQRRARCHAHIPHSFLNERERDLTSITQHIEYVKMRSSISVLILLVASQHASATVGVLDIDDLLQPNLQQPLLTPTEKHPYAPCTHKPHCATSTYLPTLGQKFCVYTSNTTGPHGLSLVFSPESARAATQHLDSNPLSSFLTQDDAEALYLLGQPWKIVNIPGKAMGVVATRSIIKYETFMVDQAAVVVDMEAEKALSEIGNRRLLMRAVEQLLVPGMVRNMSTAHAGEKEGGEEGGDGDGEEEVGKLEDDIMRTNAFGSTVAEVESRALYPLISVSLTITSEAQKRL